jgi:hypothetical protein
MVYLLLLANLLLVCAVGLALVRFLRRCDELERFWESPTGMALTDDKEGDEQLRISQRLEQRVGELQRVVKILAVRDSEPAEPFVKPSENGRVLPIENALRMTRKGASIEDLTRSCGLNIGEAKLMRKLHGKARAVASG